MSRKSVAAVFALLTFCLLAIAMAGVKPAHASQEPGLRPVAVRTEEPPYGEWPVSTEEPTTPVVDRSSGESGPHTAFSCDALANQWPDGAVIGYRTTIRVNGEGVNIQLVEVKPEGILLGPINRDGVKDGDEISFTLQDGTVVTRILRLYADGAPGCTLKPASISNCLYYPASFELKHTDASAIISSDLYVNDVKMRAVTWTQSTLVETSAIGQWGSLVINITDKVVSVVRFQNHLQVLDLKAIQASNCDENPANSKVIVEALQLMIYPRLSTATVCDLTHYAESGNCADLAPFASLSYVGPTGVPVFIPTKYTKNLLALITE